MDEYNKSIKKFIREKGLCSFLIDDDFIGPESKICILYIGHDKNIHEQRNFDKCELCQRKFPDVRGGAITCRCDGTFIINTFE